jgi:hypothetical protein
VDVPTKIFRKAKLKDKLDETAKTITIHINKTMSLSHKKNYAGKKRIT